MRGVLRGNPADIGGLGGTGGAEIGGGVGSGGGGGVIEGTD